MKKVLFVIPRFDRNAWGATENLVWNLAKALTAAHYAQCEIAAFQTLASEPAEELLSGVTIHRFMAVPKHFSLSRPASPRPELAALAEFLRGNHFDVVHHFLVGKKALFLANQLRKKGIPAVMHCRCRDFQVEPARRRFFDGPWMRRRREHKSLLPQLVNLNRHTMAMAEILLTTGLELQKELAERLPECNVAAFAPGVDFDYFSRPSGAMFRSFFQIPEAQPILLSVGRIGEQNNQKFLLEVLSVLNRRNHRCRLILLGQEVTPRSGYLKALREMAKARGLSEYLTVIPGLPPGDDRFRAAYQAASLVLLPARSNADGSAVLEAWAAGVPVISSPSGEAADFVEDGVNGRLAGVHQFTDWVSGAESFLNERLRNVHEAIRSAGSMRARELDWSARALELSKIYDSVIANFEKRRTSGGTTFEDKKR